MIRLQTSALWLIALLLAGHLGLEHIRPLILLAAHEELFIGAARRCHEALSNYREVESDCRHYDRVAAALAADTGKPPRDLDSRLIQRELLRQGAYLSPSVETAAGMASATE
jgi:hypothetical protein